MTEIEVYTSIADIPAETPGPEGDDRAIHKNVIEAGEHFANDRNGSEHLIAPAFYVQRRYVPLPRTLRVRSKGIDVSAVQRALHASHYRDYSSTGVYGAKTVDQVTMFQNDHELTPDGEYGPKTHEACAQYFDAYGAWLMTHAAAPNPKEQKLKLLVAAAFLCYHHRDAMHYTQDWRRMEGIDHDEHPPVFPAYSDCSSGATWLFYVAGIPDPNGFDYHLPAQGYTGTECVNGKKVSHRKDNRALLYFYHGAELEANETFSHVTVGIGDGMCWSNGSEGGPYIVEHDYRSDYDHCREYPL